MKFFEREVTIKQIISIFILFPILTNLLMLIPSLHFIPAIQDNVWVGFFGSYFGGIIAGLFTFLGVKFTIEDQNNRLLETKKRENRAILQLTELWKVAIDLKNIENMSGIRLVLTDSYKKAEKKKKDDALFNMVIVENVGPVGALNCHIHITITYIGTSDKFETIEFIPYIGVNEKIFIPIDNTEDYRDYMITALEIKYETMASEVITISREYQEQDGEVRPSIDYYSVQVEEGKSKPLYKIKGTKSEWRQF